MMARHHRRFDPQASMGDHLFYLRRASSVRPSAAVGNGDRVQSAMSDLIGLYVYGKMRLGAEEDGC